MPASPSICTVSAVFSQTQDSPAQSTPEDFALMRGGFVFRLLERMGAEGPAKPLLGAEAKLLLGWAVTWVPLALLSALSSRAATFLADRRAQAEFLFAVPALLAADGYVNGRIASAAQRPLLSGLLVPADVVRYRAVLVRAARWRDSWMADAAMLVLAYGTTTMPFLRGRTPSWALRGHALTAAGIWYAVLALPLLWFLLLRWSWRFAIWWDVLWQLSRLDLQLVSTHADRAGGIRYLARCQASFSVVVFAVGTVVEAMTHADEIILSKQGIFEYASTQVKFALLALAVVNLPLLHFSRKMLLAKRRGDSRFSVLMSRHAREFERKWFSLDQAQSPLGSDDMSTQTDIVSAYSAASQMWWFPVSTRAIAAVLGAGLLLPLVPRLLVDRQLITALWMLVSRK